jgi:hypothetical protein
LATTSPLSRLYGAGSRAPCSCRSRRQAGGLVDDDAPDLGRAGQRAAGGNNFWGVQVFGYGTHEYVAASDRDSGLYIFEYTP